MRRIVLTCERGVSDLARRRAIETIEERFQKSRLHLPTELQLDEQARGFLSAINQHFLRLSASLTVPIIGPAETGQIHLLPEETFRPLANETATTEGFHRNDAVYLNASLTREGPVKLLNVLAHEMFHLVSFRAYYISTNGEVIEARIGYEVTAARKEISYCPFRGLNEAVTEQSVLEMFAQERELLGRLGFNRDSLAKTPGYVASRLILNHLIKGIAKVRNETQLRTWLRFQRGMLTGQISHLRDIKKAFGRKGYAIAGVWGNKRNRMEFPEVNNLVCEYFESLDDVRKEEILKNLAL